MKKYILLLTIFSSTQIFAQVPDDALRTAWHTYNGTARNIATGGVMGSLGGDITAANINPAGLGLFKTNEFVFSPSFALNNNKFKYRGTDSSNKKNAMQYGTIGWVWGYSNSPNSKWNSGAISISVNQLASYNNNIQFKGFNNVSSFTEQYLEELVRDRADTNAALSNYIFGSSLAFRTYLIDTANNATGVFNGYKSLVDLKGGINQRYDAQMRGGLHEIAIGFAGNMQDKLYVGGSLNIPVSVYQKELTYTESDYTSNPSNKFKDFTFKESTSSVGIGIGMKLGLIYKPQEYWRLGFAVHTPQIMTYKDNIRAWLTANTETYAGTRGESSDALNNNNAGERKYNLLTPWRAIASASYVFREVNNTKKQRAFISADIEYVNYRAARFSSNQTEDASQKGYYDNINSAVKSYYKGNVNFKLGGELKFNTFMFRLGGAYYGSPYKDKELKASRVLATGGLGYRNKGMFIDLGYAHTFNKDVVFPYRLNDKANTFAEQTGSRGNVVLTLGFKF
jgi:hypothetical protein